MLPWTPVASFLIIRENMMKKLMLAVLLSALFAFPVWAVVDINSATPSQLETVKGIGPANAKAIVD